jgi:hypothetical protein
MMNNPIYNEMLPTGVMPTQMPNQPRTMNPTMISPKAFSNQGTINGVFGQAVPNTYTRNVSPLNQMTSQGYMPPVDPLTGSNQADVNAVLATSGSPLPPPVGVQQDPNPYYGLSN